MTIRQVSLDSVCNEYTAVRPARAAMSIMFLLALFVRLLTGVESSASFLVPETQMPLCLAIIITASHVDNAVVICTTTEDTLVDKQHWPWVPPQQLAARALDPAHRLADWCVQAGMQATCRETIPVITMPLVHQETVDRLLQTTVDLHRSAGSEALHAIAESMSRVRGGPVNVILDSGPRDPLDLPGLELNGERIDAEVPDMAKATLLSVVESLARTAGGVWRVLVVIPAKKSDVLVIHVGTLDVRLLPRVDLTWAASLWTTGAEPVLTGTAGFRWVTATTIVFSETHALDPAATAQALRNPAVLHALWLSDNPWTGMLVTNLIALHDASVSAALETGLRALPDAERRAAVFSRLPRPDEIGPLGRQTVLAWWTTFGHDKDPGIAHMAEQVLGKQ